VPLNRDGTGYLIVRAGIRDVIVGTSREIEKAEQAAFHYACETAAQIYVLDLATGEIVIEVAVYA
jgi:hypothetical protein